jgi:hypothetical protein
VPNLVDVELADAENYIGREVTAYSWENGYRRWGQGGILRALEPAVVLTWGNATHTFDRAKFEARTMRFAAEEALAADECIEFGPACQGAVDYFSPDGQGSAPPRCAYHREQRVKLHENSLGRYAYSDVPPSWFNPTIAGERWDDDY